MADLANKAFSEGEAKKLLKNVAEIHHIYLRASKNNTDVVYEEVRMAKQLTLLEAARLVGVDRTMLNQAVLKENIPAHRFGRQWVVNEDDVLSWVKSRRFINRAPTHKRLLTSDRVLAFVANHPGCHAGDVAQALGHSRRRAQDCMQQLELDGLIVRHVPAVQVQPWTCEITSRGQDVLADAISKGAA